MKFCKKCGKQINDSATFCKYCGHQIVSTNYSQQYSTNSGMQQNNVNNTQYNYNNMQYGYGNNKQQPYVSNNMQWQGTQNAMPNKTKKKKGKRIAVVSCIIALVIVIVSAAAIAMNNLGGGNPIKNGKNTIMIYMVGSNLERDAGYATINFEQMKKSGIDFENNNVLVFTGGCTYWHNEIPNDRNTIVKIGEESQIVWESDEILNMGKPETLSDFVNYCCENYEAENYSLIFWDHGGGYLGFGQGDYYPKDQLELVEMRQALDETPFGKDYKLDLVGFNACLMASIENADVWDEYADYLVASEESEWGAAWDFTFLKKYNETSDPVEIAKAIIDGFRDNKYISSYEYDKTLSCIDLSKVEDTKAVMDKVFSDMYDQLLDGGFNQLSRYRESTKSYGMQTYNVDGATYITSNDMVDLADVADQANSEYAEELKDTINEMVVYQYTNLDRSHGVSIYYPHSEDNISAYKDKNIAKTQNVGMASTYFSKYVEVYSSGGQTQTDIDWGMKAAEVSDEDVLTYTLSDEQMENMLSVNYSILRRTKEGVYTPVYVNREVTPDSSGKVTVDMKEQKVFTLKTGIEDSKMIFQAQQISDDGNVTVWESSDLLLCVEDYSTASTGFKRIVIRFAENNATGEINIENIREDNQETEMSSKDSVDTEHYKYVCTINRYYIPKYDKDGNLRSCYKWDSDENWEYSTIPFDGDISIVGTEISEYSDYEFVCQITVKDTAGNMYASELKDIKNESTEDIYEVKTKKGTLIYVLYPDHAELKSYIGSDKKLKIPNKVKGKPVTVIQNTAFTTDYYDNHSEQKYVESIELPKTLTTIKSSAFINCTALKTIIFKEGLEYIYENAFSGCTALKTVELPSTLKYIGTKAFSGCEKLKTINIPEKLENIQDAAFYYCEGLTNVTVDIKNKNFKVQDGVLFTADGKKLIVVFGKISGEYIVPDGVEEICTYAFWGQKKLTKASFPNSLKKIGVCAFSYCPYISEINIPDSVESIEDGAFDNMESFYMDDDQPSVKVTIGSGVEYIGLSAFSYLKISEFVVSENNNHYSSNEGFLLNKAEDTLLYCKSDVSGTLKIPSGVSTIWEGAFDGIDTELITEIVIPDSVVTIDEWATLPYDLGKITIGKGLRYWDCIDSYNSMVNQENPEEGLTIEISKDNPYYEVKDGLAVEKKK